MDSVALTGLVILHVQRTAAYLIFAATRYLVDMKIKTGSLIFTSQHNTSNMIPRQLLSLLIQPPLKLIIDIPESTAAISQSITELSRYGQGT